MYKRAAVTLAVTAAIAIGACGGGSSHLTKKDFVKKADAICTAGTQKIDKLDSPNFDPTSENLSKAQLTDAAKFLDQAVTIQSSNVDDIKKLNPPSADEKTVNDFLSLVDKGDSQMRDAASAARDGDSTKFRSAFNDAGKTLSSASSKANDYGLKECGKQ
jgi:hypothetical protein